jgi:2-phosphosulfolactate phosphatase
VLSDGKDSRKPRSFSSSGYLRISFDNIRMRERICQVLGQFYGDVLRTSALENSSYATTAMPYFDQAHFDVRCEWGMAGVQHLAPSDVTLIVDVLSFTTCVDVAVGQGATIFPYRWTDDLAAVAYAREHSAELAGRRDHVEGTYSLAPSSLTQLPCGLRLVLPSPNGSSLAFEAMKRGAIVVAGCLRNASAVAAWAMRSGKRICVLPAGERWSDGLLRPAIEDLIGAGAIIRHLAGAWSPEAEVAVRSFEGLGSRLRKTLTACSSGRELCERGFAADIELAAKLDVSQVVPVLQGEAFVACPAAEVVA